ncbi:periplasmic sensor hybrid histidine kinase [Magnetococcus marinus MC-1]|uniref:histidine kinase n=1 Tax=Magnetococcus marinus (strain ATCC BAA-1437 / JCM 17883 / MC-1) TaxID=156889 RepID=A0LCY6_MAGMM|nr:ATP-binding protein [Magnetococcus marinus]ABK45829.1 periplasmic sensor hybrid histidine kinase [Magnetococcus marinus MC-1]
MFNGITWLKPKQGAPTTEIGVSPRRWVYLQMALFLFAFILLLLLDFIFAHVIHELDQQTENQRARIFLGEQIIHNLALIEKGVYALPLTPTPRGRLVVRGQVLNELASLRNTLKVLKWGGVVNLTTHLNLSTQVQMVRSVRFHIDEHQTPFVLEMIDLEPKLDQIEDKISSLSLLLRQRDRLNRTSANQTEPFHHTIERFIKTIPPLFVRMNENANRLFYETKLNLEALEQQVAAQRSRYRTMQLLFSLLVMGLVLLMGLFIARQVDRTHHSLQQLIVDLTHAKELAESANRAKTAFLAMISHEIRTPLHGIRGMTQLLLGTETNPQQQKHLHAIEQNNRALQQIIDDLLDLASLDAQTLEIKAQPFDLLALVEQVMTVIMQQSDTKNLALGYHLPQPLHGSYLGDGPRIGQVLLKLLGNALKFTARGSITLDLALISRHETQHLIRFSVQDTGIGIAPELQEALFERFAQADDSASRRYEGAGLGLSIIKALVARMGGAIHLTSQPSQGSLFWFELPLQPLPSNGPAPLPNLTHSHLLYWHGNSIVGELQRNLLTPYFARVTLVMDEEQTLRSLWRLHAQGRPVDLLLLDHPNAVMAQELRRKLRKESPFEHLPMLLLHPHSPWATAPSMEGLHTLERPLRLRPVLHKLDQLLHGVESTPEPPVDEPQALPSLQILVAEDNLVNQQIAAGYLTRLGHRYQFAKDGIQALNLVQKGGFDLILMDVRMPDMDGLEATRHIRALPKPWCDIPIVALTANVFEQDRQNCREAGMDGFLPKPLDLSQLEQALRTHLHSTPGATS